MDWISPDHYIILSKLDGDRKSRLEALVTELKPTSLRTAPGGEVEFLWEQRVVATVPVDAEFDSKQIKQKVVSGFINQLLETDLMITLDEMESILGGES